MFNPKYVGFLVFIWFIGTLVTLIGEGAVISSNQTNILNSVLGWQQTTESTSINFVTFIGGMPQFLSGIQKMLWMDFSFWRDSGWDIVRMGVVSPIIAIIVIGLVIAFFSLFITKSS